MKRIKAAIPNVWLISIGFFLIDTAGFGATDAFAFPGIASFAPDIAWDVYTLYAASAIIFAIMTFLDREPHPLRVGSPLLPVSTVLLSVSFIFPWLVSVGFFPVCALAIGAVLRAAGTAVAFFLWAQIYCSLPGRSAAVSLSSSLIVYGGLTCLCAWACDAAPIVVLIVLAISPWISYIGIRKCASLESAAPDAMRYAEPITHNSMMLLILMNLIYGIAYGLLFYLVCKTASIVESALFVVMVIVIVIFTSRMRSQDDLGLLFRVAMIVPAISYGAMIISTAVSIPAFMVLAAIAWPLQILISLLILFDTQYRIRIRGLRVGGITSVWCTLGELIGIIMGFTGGRSISSTVFSATALVGILIMGAVFTPTRRSPTSPWGFQSMVQPESHESFVKRKTVALAREHSLTAREEEILGSLVCGMDKEQIAEEFTISPQTVKTHVKSIYAKLDVHTQRELVGLVNEKDALDEGE